MRGQREGHESQRKTAVISGSHFQPAHSDVKGTERITNFRSTTKKLSFLKESLKLLRRDDRLEHTDGSSRSPGI